MRRLSPERILKATVASISSAEYCFLITLSESGEPHARLVQPFELEENLTIWVGTWAKSRKVREIQQDNRVTLAFHDEAHTAYVALLGSAQLESDIEMKRKYWREDWIGFLPDGPEGDDYVLIQFIPSRIELMSFGQGILPKPYGLRPAVLLRVDESWTVAEETGE